MAICALKHACFLQDRKHNLRSSPQQVTIHRDLNSVNNDSVDLCKFHDKGTKKPKRLIYNVFFLNGKRSKFCVLMTDFCGRIFSPLVGTYKQTGPAKERRTKQIVLEFFLLVEKCLRYANRVRDTNCSCTRTNRSTCATEYQTSFGRLCKLSFNCAVTFAEVRISLFVDEF